MASPNTTLESPPSLPGNLRRPCPYCGTWNEPNYSFCQKCGRQLPLSGSGNAPGPIPRPPSAQPSPSPPSTAPALEDTPVFDRPITEEEKSRLRLAAKSGAAGGTRFFGAFLGIVPLAMIGMAIMGTPFVPENFTVIVLVTGFLGVALAGISQGLRAPLARAARDGTVHEVYGVPEVQTAPGNYALVILAGLTFRMKASAAAALLPNRMNRLTFADGGPTAGMKRQLGSGIAVLLETNGKTATRPEFCYVVEANGPGVSDAARGGKKLGGR